MVSDNAKTFKAAAKTAAAISESSTIADHISRVGVKWTFKRAPWWVSGEHLKFGGSMLVT